MDDRVEENEGESDDPSEVPSPAPQGVVGRLRSVWSNPAYRFAILFLVYLAIGATAYPIISRRYFFLIEAMMELTASIEYAILSPFAEDVSLSGTLVSFSTFPVRIIEECTGLYEIIIFGSAVLAFPTTAGKKAIGLGMGIPLLYLFNVVRILVLILVGRYHYRAFDFMHLYFWQATLILMITSVWLLWIFKVVRYEKQAVGSTA